jgi:SAM-dependent methyltransferase
VSDVAAYSRLAGVYDEIVVDPCYPEWAAFLHAMWRVDPVGVTSVLDVCCGTALMADQLSQLGYDVTGTDASEAMLERGRTLVGPRVRLLHQVLPDLVVEGVFDAVISTFDGLNYLTPEDFTASLAAIGSVLRPGGWLVFDLHADPMLALAAANSRVEEEWDGAQFVVTYDVDLPRRTCDSRIEFTRGDESFAEVHRQYIHDDSLVRGALTSAGFGRVAVVDDYTGRPADDTTLRATWIARRAVS